MIDTAGPPNPNSSGDTVTTALFWYVGGTDPGVYHQAELHPTLETGIQTRATASLSYLGHERTASGV